MTDPFAVERRRMIERQLVARGIADPKVLAAMARVPREAFIAPELAKSAYDDSPLPIAEGQTISQPYIVALMTEAACVGSSSRVLEVGSGSGYAAAVLSELAASVVTIERHAKLAASAREILKRLGYSNVDVIEGDGSRGMPERAPFDAILVAAAAPEAPESLKRQLAEGGRLVIPISANSHQDLRVISRRGDRFEEEDLGPVRFVPLLGKEGWGEG
jgi:protein-L-isoaspartate(D-aspartate) O-methyltransferase